MANQTINLEQVQAKVKELESASAKVDSEVNEILEKAIKEKDPKVKLQTIASAVQKMRDTKKDVKKATQMKEALALLTG